MAKNNKNNKKKNNKKRIIENFGFSFNLYLIGWIIINLLIFTYLMIRKIPEKPNEINKSLLNTISEYENRKI